MIKEIWTRICGTQCMLWREKTFQVFRFLQQCECSYQFWDVMGHHWALSVLGCDEASLGIISSGMWWGITGHYQFWDVIRHHWALSVLGCDEASLGIISSGMWWGITGYLAPDVYQFWDVMRHHWALSVLGCDEASLGIISSGMWWGITGHLAPDVYQFWDVMRHHWVFGSWCLSVLGCDEASLGIWLLMFISSGMWWGITGHLAPDVYQFWDVMRHHWAFGSWCLSVLGCDEASLGTWLLMFISSGMWWGITGHLAPDV